MKHRKSTMKLFQTTLLLTSITLASSDSFSGLTYESTDESAQSLIDYFLDVSGHTDSTHSPVSNGGSSSSTSSTIGTTSYTTTGTTSTSSEETSTVASYDTDVEIDFISEEFTESTPQNICAPSLADAESKLCNNEPFTECRSPLDCSRMEACWGVVCSGTTTSTTATASETTSSSENYESSEFDGGSEITQFYMLGSENKDQAMMMAKNNPQTTTTATSMVFVELFSKSSESEGSSSSQGKGSSSSQDKGSSSSDSSNMSQFSAVYTSSTSTTTISSKIESTLTSIQETIDNDLFLYETPLSEWIPSTVYRFDGFFDGLKVMHSVGVAGKKLYLGGNSPEYDFLGTQSTEDETNCPHCFMYGLVNIAAFLAQAMKETIRYDACDENSWDRVGSLEMYPISNSCGQLGQSYQDYHCSEEEKHMECPVDPEMSITAVTHAKWWGSPGPLMCGPKSEIPQTGYWDYSYECNNPWANPPESCDVYEDQKAGKAINDEPYPNAAGRTDVEGCCWWGRGVIQTSGVCNFGKLNYFLGKRAFLEGRDSRYPDIDFCRDPEIICTSEEHKELKWIAGFFYWVDQVQPYDNGGWNYLAEVKKFVDGGMTGDAFINSVSGIVNRGCHNPPCGTGDLDGGPERAENFFRILDALEFSFVDVVPMEPPKTEPPTSLPTTPMPVAATTPVPTPATVSYTCSQSVEAGALPEESPTSMYLIYDYELHSDLDVAVSQALQEIKETVLSDIAGKLGCTEMTKRRLQVSGGNVVGLTASRSDLPDPDAAGCLVEVDVNEPTVCTPIKGEIKVFAEAGLSDEDLQSVAEYLKSSIRDNMDSGLYESDKVKRVTWIGDRNLYMKEMNPQPPAPIIQTEPIDDSEFDWIKIAMYSLAGVCAFLLCLLCMIIPSTRRKSPSHDEELAMVEYMNAHKESQYKGDFIDPQDAIQRRTERLRAVQRGGPLLESEATAEESDDDSYFRRRHSMQKQHVDGGPPVLRIEPRRQSASAPAHNAIVPHADPEECEAIQYHPQQRGGVDSEHSSEEEENEHPSRRRRHTMNHDPRANAERHRRRSTRSNANGMTKEERQRRIERTRSNRH